MAPAAYSPVKAEAGILSLLRNVVVDMDRFLKPLRTTAMTLFTSTGFSKDRFMK
jgi:hypothetical protein